MNCFQNKTNNIVYWSGTLKKKNKTLKVSPEKDTVNGYIAIQTANGPVQLPGKIRHNA